MDVIDITYKRSWFIIIGICCLIGLIIKYFPQHIPLIYAFNPINNWGFESPSGANLDATGWTKTGTDDISGTKVLVVTDNSVRYAGTQSVRGFWKANGNNQVWNYTLYQNFTPASSAKAKLRGYYRREWSSSNANETSSIVLELASGTSGGTGGSVILTAFSDARGGSTGADANFTTAPNSGTWSSEVTLNSGTTYTIRIRWEGTAMDKNESGGAWVDGVELSLSPVGVTASAPADTTNVVLTWTGSSPGSGANALHATTPYKVYRSTLSPVTTGNFLANASANSYTDTSTTGNTTYYYAITDVDTAGTESPLSVEGSRLTRPGVPVIQNCTNVKESTLTVNWNAPNGGASSYKIERCSGSGCSNWAEIASGQTGTSYNDSNLNGGTLYRYRVRATNVTGDSAYSSITETTTGIVSISITSDGSVHYGYIAPGIAKDTLQLSDTQTVRNTGNLTATLNIKTSQAAGGTSWSVGATPGNNVYVHEYSTNGGSTWMPFSAADTYYTLATGIAGNSNQNIDLRMTAPSSASDFNEKTITITIQAVAE